ncbi:hypothetical protein RRG08_031778 [Elysia crispata]|uniref:C-type lectin domain-containing protein n=1 Tax=Elysia crispata TaxID=231223 RepID=A0AAE1DVJ1_9GAST|nr:hypothetical protein RRG08_031778 [Elysia crispata]
MILICSGLLLLALSASCADSIVENSCRPDALNRVPNKYFRVRNGTCFLFMTYDKVVYETAGKKCQNSGGTLAMPKTKDINDFLLREMKKLNTDQPMWIGMNDKEEEGTVVWEDGSKVDAWSNFDWINGGLFGVAEDCFALNPNNGKWHDYGCSNARILMLSRESKLPFICQYRIKDDSLGDVNGDEDNDGSLGNGGQGNIDDVGKGDKVNGDDVGKGKVLGTKVTKIDHGNGDDNVKDDQKDNDDKGGQIGSKIAAKPDQASGDNVGKVKAGVKNATNVDKGVGSDDVKVQIGMGDLVDPNENCPPFNCPNLDCGMSGFKMEKNCQVCECEE